MKTVMNQMHMKSATVRSPRAQRVGLALLLALLTVMLVPALAQAHRGAQSYLYLDVAEEDLRGRVEMPFEDITEVFGIEVSGSDDDKLASLGENLAELQAYAAAHSSIGGDGFDYEMTFDGVELVDGAEYAVFPFVVAVPDNLVPRKLTVSFDPFIDEIDGRDAILLISNDWRRGVFDEEANELVVFDSNTRIQDVDLGDPSQWRNFKASTNLGIDHIQTGPDHVFFVLVLMLPSVLLFANGWKPAKNFGAALWRVMKVATMFTLAHSITFTLAGLDLLPLPPSRVVESIIALSITAAALHNLWPVLRNREWLIAFLFGLFHGMGFASLVEGLEVSRSTQLVSLLGRNVGIEIGQAVVVLIAFPALFLLRRTRYYRPIFIAGSIGLALISLAWGIERIFETDLKTDVLVDRIVEWPRALYAMIVVTALCAAIYYIEKLADRLISTADVDAVAELDEQRKLATAGR